MRARFAMGLILVAFLLGCGTGPTAPDDRTSSTTWSPTPVVSATPGVSVTPVPTPRGLCPAIRDCGD